MNRRCADRCLLVLALYGRGVPIILSGSDCQYLQMDHVVPHLYLATSPPVRCRHDRTVSPFLVLCNPVDDQLRSDALSYDVLLVRLCYKHNVLWATHLDLRGRLLQSIRS